MKENDQFQWHSIRQKVRLQILLSKEIEKDMRSKEKEKRVLVLPIRGDGGFVMKCGRLL